MSAPKAQEQEKHKEHSCGCCAGCVLSPVVFLVLASPVVMLIDYLAPGADWDGGLIFGLFGLPMILATGAFLGAVFSRQLVGLLKEIKWRLWDS
jgi:hypothetical protein